MSAHKSPLQLGRGDILRGLLVFMSVSAAFLMAGYSAAAQEELPAERHKDPEFEHLYMGVSESCLICHGDFALFEDKGPERKYFYIDRAVFGRSVHFELGCIGCHEPMRAGVHTRRTKGEVADEETEGLQEKELLNLRTCEGCHFEEHSKYRQSVHGLAALRDGVAEAPLCVDVPFLCDGCHGDSLINAKFGLNPEVVATYGESFHGKKEALGARRMPVCISCHGVHLIYSVEDEKSMVNDANISRTCGQCHPGAERSFKAAFSHQKLPPVAKAVLFYVEQFYLWLIFLVIGGMLLFVSLHLLYHLRKYLRTS